MVLVVSYKEPYYTYITIHEHTSSESDKRLINP